MGLSRGRALVACGILSVMSIGVWACSQGDPQPPFIPDPPNDAASSGGDVVKADVAKPVCLTEDGGCSALASCGSKIYVVDVAQSGPTGQGGTVVDGTYILTDYRVFTGTGGTSGQQSAYFQETMSFVSSASDGGAADGGEGGTSQLMVWEDNISTNMQPTAFTSSGIAQFSGASLTITHTCPNSNIFSGTFTASSTQLILFAQETSGVGQLTYTKQ